MSPSQGQGHGWLACASGLFLELPGRAISRESASPVRCWNPSFALLLRPEGRVAPRPELPARPGLGGWEVVPKGPKYSAPFAVLSLGQITAVAFKPQSLHRQKGDLKLNRIGVRSVRVIPAGGTEEVWSTLPSLAAPPAPREPGAAPTQMPGEVQRWPSGRQPEFPHGCSRTPDSLSCFHHRL